MYILVENMNEPKPSENPFHQQPLRQRIDYIIGFDSWSREGNIKKMLLQYEQYRVEEKY